jgi:hypothetical protein
MTGMSKKHQFFCSLLEIMTIVVPRQLPVQLLLAGPESILPTPFSLTHLAMQRHRNWKNVAFVGRDDPDKSQKNLL